MKMTHPEESSLHDGQQHFCIAKKTEEKSFDRLPCSIDPVLCVKAFQSQREEMLSLLRHCLASTANSFYAKLLIPRDVYEEATDRSVSKTERTTTLLDCIEARIKSHPSDFATVLGIFESEPFLSSLAEQLISSYRTLVSSPTSGPALVSPAVLQYSDYLKRIYRNCPISPDSKWPPTPSKAYIQLALVDGYEKCREDYIGHILEGDVREALKVRVSISLDQIVEPGQDKESVRLVVIEGAPGIGKSTLAWELCRRWEEEASIMKQYSLAVLLRLREKRVQKSVHISDLFFSYKVGDQKPLVDEVVSCHGRGVLFILDGFDELPVELQREGLLVELVKKNVLPESTVVVTSRPSAIAELFTVCRPLIQKQVEILGFTQESVKAYAESVFSNLVKLESFMNYISAARNPAIHSLMYVPINAAIIVQIYSESKSQSHLPHTLTQLYTQLSLTILNKYLKETHPSVTVNKFSDLSEDFYQCFLKLSKIAFEGIKNQQIIFYSDSVPRSFNHFGFLDAVSTLSGGGEISYNFLHLTLQEFFAAYHISQHFPDGGVQLFRKYSGEKRWNVVWRFVAGLTKFHHFEKYAKCSTFVKSEDGVESLTVFCIQCLYEAQTVVDFKTCFGKDSMSCIYGYTGFYSPLDYFALGYCISQCSTEQSYWNIECKDKETQFDYFLHGLLSNKTSSTSGIQRLAVHSSNHQFSRHFGIEQLGTCITLSPALFMRVTEFSIDNSRFRAAKNCLLEILSHLFNLKKLNIQGSHFEREDSNFLKRLHDSKVTSLNITGCNISGFLEDSSQLCIAFKALIHPVSGTLKELFIGINKNESKRLQRLISLVSSPSSLHHLSIRYNSVVSLKDCFNFDSRITKLTLETSSSEYEHDVIAILQHCTAVRHLYVNLYKKVYGAKTLCAIATSLKANSTLEKLIFYGHSNNVYYHGMTKDLLASLDPRAELLFLPAVIDSDWNYPYI